MPPRRGTPEGITIGFLGTGAMDVDAGMVLIQEYLDANIKPSESVKWMFVLVDGEFTATLTEYVAIAKSSDIVYEVITRSSDTSKRAFVEMANDAAKVINVEDPILQLEQSLKEAPRSALFLLWDKERDTSEQEEMFSSFIDAGLDVRELTEGLIPMSFEGGEEAEPAAAADEDEGEATEEMEIFARTDLEKMSMDDLKDIGAQLGVPPKKTRQAMVDLILAAQGEPEEAQEAPVPPGEPIAAVAVVETAVDVSATLQSFLSGLDEWANQLGGKFDDFLTRLDKVEIQVAVPRQGGAPAPAPEPATAAAPTRRLRRG
jgi:hypothetical protein